MATIVPNKFPPFEPTQHRLAVVGEAPGADELVAGEPFVGTSGRFLRAILGNSGIATSQVFFGNVCQHNPLHNEIDSFDYDGPEIQSGLERLRTDLSVFRPNCILLLGKTAFRAARPDLCHPSKKGFVVPLGNWRGSLFKGGRGFDYKCVATYHPAYILRAYADAPYFKFDVARAVQQSLVPELRVPTRDGLLRPTACQVVDYCKTYQQEKLPVTWDIEGFADDVGITMLSLCTRKDHGIVVPFWLNGSNYWSEDEEVAVWTALADLLADPQVPKCAHNAFYELFVSAWRHRIIINNLHDDTMMKTWEKFPELERSLAVACSLYTLQPFYKGDRLSDSPDVKLRYNLTDSLVTHEINEVLTTELARTPRSYDHYRFNVNLIPAVNYLMLRGCKLDLTRVRSLSSNVEQEVTDLNTQIQEHLGRDFNVKSVVDKHWLLYTHLGYKPLQRWGETTKEDALLYYHSKHHEPIVRLVIRCVRKRTRLSDIHKLVPDADGRIRTSYDLVGTPTGRLTSRESIALRLTSDSWENTGTNLQNVTNDLRVCLIPDDPSLFDFWQRDLSGADGWTVAADLASLGYPTMLEDYIAGIKPALVLYHILQEHAAGRDPSLVNTKTRDELKVILRAVKAHIDSLAGGIGPDGRPLDWQYLCCKRIQHGSNYGARPGKIAEVIFGDSDGSIDLSLREATLYQHFYKLRYQCDHRNEAIRRRLVKDGALIAACGIRRQFFGIRNHHTIDDAIIREASAFEPQANTTYCTNMALGRMWYDRDNRQSTGALHIEPLLHIHDALAGQHRQRDRGWAHEKLVEWFNNPITIAGTRITIPADGGYGTSWGDCKHSYD